MPNPIAIRFAVRWTPVSGRLHPAAAVVCRAVTLAIAFKGPEGVALAVDSRVTLTAVLPTGQQFPAYFDNATKLLSVQGQHHVGIVTYGMGAIGAAEPRTAHGFIPEFEAQLGAKYDKRADVADIAGELGRFYTEQWKLAKMPPVGPNVPAMVFLVAGFNEGDAYGRVYEVSVPDRPGPVEQNAGTFGLTFGGQNELAGRLINGLDPRAPAIAKDQLGLTDTQVDGLRNKWAEQLSLPIPYAFLPLQDCVDLSAFLVNMTSVIQTWTVGIRGVGGDVDVATITRTEGFKAIKQKRIQVWE